MQILLVPGGGGSGPDHWHTYWEAQDHRIKRIVQADWNHGTRSEWVATLDRYIQDASLPTVLVAHSLGNAVVSHWAASDLGSGPVVGALLVAPVDIDGEWVSPGSLYETFRPDPMQLLPFPTIVVASTNDPYLSIEQAQRLATAWGSRLRCVGASGHIGSDSKLEHWPVGRKILNELLNSIPSNKNKTI